MACFLTRLYNGHSANRNIRLSTSRSAGQNDTTTGPTQKTHYDTSDDPTTDPDNPAADGAGSRHNYTVIGQVGHTYDKNRNVLADGTREFRYNYKNQLRHVWRKSDGDTVNTGTLAKYREDAFGRRVHALSYWELASRKYLDTRFDLDVNVDADNDGAAMAPGQRGALPRYVRCTNCGRRHHQQPRPAPGPA